MSLVGRGFFVLKTKTLLFRGITKSAILNGSTANNNTKQISEDAIRKSVFISQSTDIHTNLALEDWFYRNYDFTNHHVLLLWKNDPCVVIGRHQNPWIESNVGVMEALGISLARRNSGGGTVYHDAGNVNLSFFTPRERYNRRYNLEIMTRALYREWGIKTEINKREDIVVKGDFKVSGTAARLGRPNAYHHCTLLVGVNKSSLSAALERKEIQTDTLMNAVGWEYLRTKALSLVDGGDKLIERQKGFQMINPTEDWFPGLEKLKSDLKSWDWTFGKSPKFTVTRSIEVPATDGECHTLNLTLDVQNGIVEDIKISLPKNFAPQDAHQDASVITNLRGTRYSDEIMERIISSLGCKTVTLDTAKDVSENNMAVEL